METPQIKLNKQQEEAANLIVEWYNTVHTTGKQIFTLAGFAGTGKSTLVNYVLNNLLDIKKEVAVATPTGKAAAVLLQKGVEEATTIHRLIYTLVEDEVESVVNGKTIHSKKLRFVKRNNVHDYGLIVLDEISMVSKQIMEDLVSFGIPILACGDSGQLKSIQSEGNDLLDHPDYTLTEIVRQASDNAILQVATMARQKKFIPYGEYNNCDVVVYDKNLLKNSEFSQILLSSDQVICGKNSTRIKLNKLIRNLLKKENKLPENDEKLICELNNYTINFGEIYSLVNGMSGYVKNFKILDDKLKLASISFRPDFLTEEDDYVDNILIEYGIFETDEYKYEKHQDVYIMNDATYKIATRLTKRDKNESREEYIARIRLDYLTKKTALATGMINQFQYGYAISCHKAQGSQWDSVVVIDESKVFGKDASSWLYTAITRAAKKLIIIR